MNYIHNDFYFSNDGDFILSANKDIQDTSTDPYRSLIQEIKTRLDYNRGDWRNNLGANLEDFVGKPNNKKLSESIKLRVTSELTKDGLVSAGDLIVDVVPLSKENIMIIIKIKSNTKIVTINHKFSIREKSFGSKGSP